MGLKNAAKQKLAFRKVLRIISDLQKKPEPTENISNSSSSTPKQEENHETNGYNDDNKEEPTKDIETKPEPTPKKKDPNDILKEMLDNGTVSNKQFWSHFFNDVTSQIPHILRNCAI